jgi:hypothetical protein
MLLRSAVLSPPFFYFPFFCFFSPSHIILFVCLQFGIDRGTSKILIVEKKVMGIRSHWF